MKFSSILLSFYLKLYKKKKKYFVSAKKLKHLIQCSLVSMSTVCVHYYVLVLYGFVETYETFRRHSYIKKCFLVFGVLFNNFV